VIERSYSVVFLFAVAMMILGIGMAYADTGVPAVPEVQGVTTGTSATVVGTVTETDSGTWTLTNDPFVIDTYLAPGEIPIFLFQVQQLQAAGGSIYFDPTTGSLFFNVPESLLQTPVAGALSGESWATYLTSNGFTLSGVTDNGIHSGVLDPGQVQYTTGYNDQYSGVSGQQTFVKSMALSTANKIPDQSNIKANTDIQFIAVDTGRATRTEDLLLDGAAQAQDSSELILCPFANANPGIIPAFCNIVQAASAFDTTLTSTVTLADTRFVGTDATVPVVLNYNINAQGITLTDGTSSPMIGSVSAYLKVHVQEARNESTSSGPLFFGSEAFGQGEPLSYSFPDVADPIKSEDLAYSETSTASGLISKFSKSMSYSSQASAVQAPPSQVSGMTTG
jgi:hypothetical protein